jgi:hypothetical protein
MSAKNETKHLSVTNHPWDLSYADCQKLIDGFEVSALLRYFPISALMISWVLQETF